MKARWINNRGGGRISAPARDAAALHCKTLRALPVILGNCVIIGGIVLAILTARDNIFSAAELSSGKFDFRIAAVRPPLSLPKSVQFLRPTAIARRLLTARTPPGVARHRGVPA